MRVASILHQFELEPPASPEVVLDGEARVAVRGIDPEMGMHAHGKRILTQPTVTHVTFSERGFARRLAAVRLDPGLRERPLPEPLLK